MRKVKIIRVTNGWNAIVNRPLADADGSISKCVFTGTLRSACEQISRLYLWANEQILDEQPKGFMMACK